MHELNHTPSNPQPPKKVLIETWGCQMNVADSEKMLGMLQQQNYQVTENETEADLILLNTCHIREKAKHKVLSRLGTLKDLHKDKPKLRIAVTGCVAQAEGAKLFDQASNIDILVGPGKIDELPRLLQEREGGQHSLAALGFKREHGEHGPHEDAGTANPTITGKSEISRYVNIAQGCDNFCTFCVVPFTRGREISRMPSDIAAEVQRLTEGGAQEITLLGQNVNSYGHDLVQSGQLAPSTDGAFVDLLRRVGDIPSVKRLRFTTSNPHDFTRPLAELFREYPKLGRYIHLPVQSGNDHVLERMKRKVTVAEYWERIQWLRNVDPAMAISTDLIVGFPGETDEEFEGTVELVQKVEYSFIFSFKYSPRKGTAAARFKDQIDEAVKDQRLQKLNMVQDAITLRLNQQEIGRTHEVLCHYESRKEPGFYYGRTPYFRLVKIPSSRNLVGETVTVEIVDANKTALLGRLL